MQGAETEGPIHGSFYGPLSGDRRIVLLDSATLSEKYVHAAGVRSGTEVLVNASYTGVYCARLLQQVSPLGVIGLDCGIGKDGAGIAGLWYFEALGIPAAASDIGNVELGHGRDLYANGTISRVNGWAEALGIKPGMAVREAADVMLHMPDAKPPVDTTNRVVVERGPNGRAVVCTDSIFEALPEDRDTNVLCTAGHTGRSVVGYIVDSRPYGFICSDGGMGKHQSGISALPLVSREGIAGASVSAATARMGDGRSTYFDGVISAANELALAAGVRVGQPATEAAHLLLYRET